MVCCFNFLHHLLSPYKLGTRYLCSAYQITMAVHDYVHPNFRINKCYVCRYSLLVFCIFLLLSYTISFTLTIAMYLLISSLHFHNIILIINVSASALQGLGRTSIMIALECRLPTASFCRRVNNVPRLSIAATTRASAGGTVHDTVLPVCVPFGCVALSVQADKSIGASIS